VFLITSGLFITHDNLPVALRRHLGVQEKMGFCRHTVFFGIDEKRDRGEESFYLLRECDAGA